MNTLLNSYFVKTHRLEISITIIAIVLFLIYFLGAPHVFTRFPIYRAFNKNCHSDAEKILKELKLLN